MRPWSRRSLVPNPGGTTELTAGEGIYCIEVEDGSQAGIRLALEDGHEAWSGQTSIPLLDGASIPLGGVKRCWIAWPASATTATRLELTVWHLPAAQYVRAIGGPTPVSVSALPLPAGAATEVTLAAALAALGPLATQTTLADVLTALGSLATQATLAGGFSAVLAALGDLATEVTLGDVLTALGPVATEATLGDVLTALGVKPEPTYELIAAGTNVSAAATVWLPGAATSYTLHAALTAGTPAQREYSRLLLYVGRQNGTTTNNTVVMYSDFGLGGTLYYCWGSNLRGVANVPVGNEGLIATQELPVPAGAFRLALLASTAVGTWSYQLMGVRD